MDSEHLSFIEKSRRIVEEAVFDRLGRPSFFDEAVEQILGQIAARIAEKNLEARAEACVTRATGGSGRQWQQQLNSVRIRATVELDTGVGNAEDAAVGSGECNRQRLHSALGYRSREEFEQKTECQAASRSATMGFFENKENNKKTSKGLLGKGTQTPAPSPDPNPC